MNSADALAPKPRSLGLRAKIILPLMGVVVLASVVGVALVHRTQRGQRELRVADRAGAITHSIMHLADHVDPEQLQYFVTAMSRESGVKLILVASGEPLTVVASSCPGWNGCPISDLPVPDHLQQDLSVASASRANRGHIHNDSRQGIDFTHPLRTRVEGQNGARIVHGAILLRMDALALRQEQRAVVRQLVLAVVGTVVLALFATYVLLRSLVLEPLAAIARVAGSTVDGERTARVRVDRSDELGHLAAKFNRMLDELAAREEQERESNRQTLEASREAEAALAELRRHRFAIDQHAIVEVTDPSGMITYANDRCCKISQYSREELLGEHHQIVNSGYHPPEFWQDMWRVVSRGDVWRNEVRNRAKDGALYWVDTTVVPFKDADGRITQYVAIRSDITSRKIVEASLAEREQQFRTLVNNIPGVPYRCLNDRDWTMLFIADAVEEMTGYPASEFIENRVRSYASIIHPDDRDHMARTVSEAVTQRKSFAIEYRIVRADGTLRTVSEQGQPVIDPNSGEVRFLDGAILDVSSLKRAEHELQRAARLDKLTGLPNRGLFLDRLQQTVLRSQRSQKFTYAVMFLDFDRFKIINDSLGHNIGDALLTQIAERLRHHVRAVDSISADATGCTGARLGGDEFVVLLDEMGQPEDAEVVAQRLMDALSEPYQLGKHEVYSTASIGIVIGDASYEQAEDVVRDADTAMYEAKRRGRACYVVFDASMRERVQRHLKLENDLRRALGTHQLSLTYQPIVSLSDGTLYGVEALLRWTHPTDGEIDPAEFVPIAEETDLILNLGEWVIREGCTQLAAWDRTLGSQSPRCISLNLSRKQFSMPNLPQLLAQVVTESGTDPSRIQLEITEDAFSSDVDTAVKTMWAIKSLGIELAIDDFGTGTSSFAALHQFPVDALKIHRSLLKGIEDSRDVASLIHGLAVMVKNLKIDMIAKGVETSGQLIALQELGCEHAQGFYFSPALPAEQIPSFASRVLSLDYRTTGATAYSNSWIDRLTILETFDSPQESP